MRKKESKLLSKRLFRLANKKKKQEKKGASFLSPLPGGKHRCTREGEERGSFLAFETDTFTRIGEATAEKSPRLPPIYPHPLNEEHSSKSSIEFLPRNRASRPVRSPGKFVPPLQDGCKKMHAQSCLLPKVLPVALSPSNFALPVAANEPRREKGSPRGKPIPLEPNPPPPSLPRPLRGNRFNRLASVARLLLTSSSSPLAA